jgi:hypothetical protein
MGGYDLGGNDLLTSPGTDFSVFEAERTNRNINKSRQRCGIGGFSSVQIAF